MKSVVVDSLTFQKTIGLYQRCHEDNVPKVLIEEKVPFLFVEGMEYHLKSELRDGSTVNIIIQGGEDTYFLETPTSQMGTGWGFENIML